MGLKAPARGQVVIAVLFALSVFGFTLFVWRSFGGSIPLAPKGYRVTALFGPEATNLTPNAQVRISGVPVGHVVSTQARGHTVRATLQIDNGFAPLPDDVRAIVRFKTLLGETFVELSPGSPSAPKLADGATLPERSVQRAQQIDQVLGSFDAPTRRNFKRFVQGFGDALDGRGQDLNDALGEAAPTAEDVDRLATLLARQDPALRSLVRDSGTTLEAIGSRGRALQDLVTSGNRVFSATARRNRELTATVRALPGFLADLHRTLEPTDAAVREAAPVLRTLRPAAGDVRPALLAARSLAPQVQQLAQHLRPAVGELRVALPALTGVVRDARPLLGQLNASGAELVPLVQFLTAYRQEVVSLLANLGAAANGTAGTKGSDGKPQRYVRAIPPATTEQIYGWAQRAPSNRANPYPRPGYQADLGRPVLRTFGCAHLSNPQVVPVFGSVPQCLTQQPWTFNGKTRSYPHLERHVP